MNKRHWIKYLLITVIGFLIVKWLQHEEIKPIPEKKLASPQAASPKTTEMISFPAKNIPPVPAKKIEIAEKQEKPKNKTVEFPYKVEIQFPTQHFFDDNTCNRGEVRDQFAPERNNAIERLDYQFEHHYYQLNDNLELNLYASNASDYFKESLTERLKILHDNYLQMLGPSAKQKITLNLIVAPNRDEYLYYTSFYSTDIDASLGVYFGGLNLAFIDYQASDDNALRTTIHESVHALNAHLIGRTPYMFNEGMAELYEDMSKENGKTELLVSKKKLTKETYPMMLFFDDQQWAYLDTADLYYSSWVLAAFMHSNKERLGALVYFMYKERQDPCSPLTADQSYSTFLEAYNMFESDFDDWQQSQAEQ